MEDEIKKTKMEVYSARLSRQTKENLTELQNSGDFTSVNQMFETLIEGYYNPKKAKDQADKIQQLEEELAKFKTLNEELNNSIDAITAERNKLLEENLQLREIINTSKLPPDTHAIKIDPLNWEILKYVANREGKARNQEWTPEDVINYFIHHRFERGDVNGGFKSVPDSKIREMKQALSGEGEE